MTKDDIPIKQQHLEAGPGGGYRVTLGWTGSMSAKEHSSKRWRVELSRRVPLFWGLLRRWRPLITITQIRRLAHARRMYEMLQRDMQWLAEGEHILIRSDDKPPAGWSVAASQQGRQP